MSIPVKPSVASGAISGEPARQAQIFSRFRRDLEDVEIKEYDFRRPGRLSRDQLHGLAAVHEEFALALGASLSGLLRTAVEARLVAVEQATWAEFSDAVPEQSAITQLDCRPLEGSMALEMAPQVAYPIIERLLGGTVHRRHIPPRAMTVIEQSVLRVVLDRCIASLANAWRTICCIKFTLGAMETNPQISLLAPADSPVAVIRFEIIMAGRAGALNLCIPFATIQPMIDALESSSATRDACTHARTARECRAMIAQHLSSAMVDVRGVLAETTLTLAELRDLQVGDVITTEKPASAPAMVLAAGSPKFLADLGQHQGRRVLKIVLATRVGERL